MKQGMRHENSYGPLGLMFVLHFIAMYILMYAMVDRLSENVYHSLNNLYMAALMTSSMIAIELALMRSMYPNRGLNVLLATASIGLLALSFMFIRKQVAVGDEQFIRSMIPHHSGAILMCQNATITDAELKSLCSAIISSQQEEISQMKKILQRLDSQ